MEEYPIEEIPIVSSFNRINREKRNDVKNQVVCLIFNYWHLMGKTILEMTGCDITDIHMMYEPDSTQLDKERITVKDSMLEIDENTELFLAKHHKTSWFNYLFDMPIDVSTLPEKTSMCWYIADFWILILLNADATDMERSIQTFKERFASIFQLCTERERINSLVIDESDFHIVRQKMGITPRHYIIQDGETKRLVDEDWRLSSSDFYQGQDEEDRDYCKIIIHNEARNRPHIKVDENASTPASQYGEEWIHMVSKYLLMPIDMQRLCKCCKRFRTLDDQFRYNPYMLYNLDDFERFKPHKKKYVRYEDAQNSFLLLDAKLCAKSYLVYRNLYNLWDLNEHRKEEN